MHMISEPSFVEQKQGGSFIFIYQTLRRETEFKVKESIRSHQKAPIYFVFEMNTKEETNVYVLRFSWENTPTLQS